jgi:nitroreductase
MDITDTIRQRKSIRAFRSDPVPQKILKEILELSRHAPSWENTQPWELTIVGGNILDNIRQAFIESANANKAPNPDIPWPSEFPEPYSVRRRAIGKKLFEIRSIGREDKAKRRWWMLQGLSLFGAPNAIYVCIDRSLYHVSDPLNVWPILDCGLIVENILLLAVKYGLGTIPQAQAVVYPDVLRNILGIQHSKLIVLGISIGYPKWDDPINQFNSEREALDNVANWYGFD